MKLPDCVLVANRGAIARRVIRACSELGIRTVAVYAASDDAAPYLEEADQAFMLPGYRAADTYLNQQALLEIARRAGADAVHPGYGFLAENAGFASAVIEQGLTFIGPRPKWLAQMGDKVAARGLFEARGFPVFAGSDLLRDEADARDAAERVGYPLMVKPSGGGGGMGMQMVFSPDELSAALHQARAVAGSAFADDGVYLERLVQRPRHVEFQILADRQGGAMHGFERDCSVQRRNQKLIEESPAPGIDPQALLRQAELAARVCADIGYDNIGTLETLVDEQGELGFLEMNTRIQVEHGVTEAVTGLDLVRTQIELACGGSLPQTLTRQGFAMEARLYAEDSRTLLPSTGVLNRFRPPRMQGVRVETGYAEGQAVTPYFDAMLAKIIATGSTREMAIGRLAVALQAFEVRGVSTNAGLLQRILGYDEFVDGKVHTGLVQQILEGSDGQTRS